MLYLIYPRFRPIQLSPGQSLDDLSLAEQVERGIDWEATAKASLIVKGIGK